MLVGGNGAKVIDRVLAFGDEWLPNRIGDEDAFAKRLEELRHRAADAGRDPIPVTVYGGTRKPETLERWSDLGVHRSVYWLPPVDAGEAERRLDEVAGLVAEFGGAA